VAQGKSLDNKQKKRIIHFLADRIYQESSAPPNLREVIDKFVRANPGMCFRDQDGQPDFGESIVRTAVFGVAFVVT
jgi:hypothetical protein